MTKVVLAWDRPSFTPEDEELLRELIERGLVCGVKTGHITDAIEDDHGVSLSSRIRSYVKDLISQENSDRTAIYFNDKKYYDVGKTIIEATRQIVERSTLGNRVDLLTFHPDMSIETLRVVARICKDAGTTALLTTVLTDMSPKEYKKRFSFTPIQRALRVAALALECGIHGIVCSGNELLALKREGFVTELVTVIPGIRPLWATTQGQARMMTPERAAVLGATYEVIGSPILGHQNPIQAATLIQQSIADVSNTH